MGTSASLRLPGGHLSVVFNNWAMRDNLSVPLVTRKSARLFAPALQNSVHATGKLIIC